MTTQENFKKRIRERMAKTGERYAAARQQLIDRAAVVPHARIWQSEPEAGDDAVRAATGLGWNDWCDRLDEWEGRDGGHTGIAAHLRTSHGLDGWWSQQVAGGYERITGRRLPGEMPDGTFTANRSATVAVDAAALRAMLLSDADRLDLFPGVVTELRSSSTSKVIRIRIGPGVAKISLSPKPDGRVVVGVQHTKLPEAGDVGEWKHYWSEWFDAIADDPA